ncbi:hypothetical protein B5X24_HaOG214529 [Helicoverpa armigera]|uniref:Uncharacterized protein n=1 Tax=Helicoverpa armigera TaxID=29058 RepID=A0A2W1BH00_HELAM|nr:hypothetical protein B5X24_HaOG214529 [Helicoverpa armigera]
MKPENTIDLLNSSTLNELISVPLPDKFVAENHNTTFAEIQQKIDAAKQAELETFPHDHVHHIVIYTVLFLVCSLLLTIVMCYARYRWNKRKSNEGKPGSTTTKDETSSIEIRVEPKPEDNSKQTRRTNLARRTQSNVDIATSPGLPRTIKFNLSASTSNLSNQ